MVRAPTQGDDLTCVYVALAVSYKGAHTMIRPPYSLVLPVYRGPRERARNGRGSVTGQVTDFEKA